MGDNSEVKTGPSSLKPPANGNDGPVIKESGNSSEYEKDLQLVIGTAIGVICVFCLIALTFLAYRIYKQRRRARNHINRLEVEAGERDITLDIGVKSRPVVLLLYAFDCPVHEQVISALAGFLMEDCGVTVTLDLFEENEIVERGIDDWLVDRLQESDFILVVCSLGARLRCSKKRIKFKQDSSRLLPDYFAVAVDYVAEKMRVEKQKGLGSNKFACAYMDYSTRSDIPPQLETASQFCLMKDIHKLHLYLNVQDLEMDKSELENTCEEHYQESETGALLKATLEQAKLFFKKNPSWMDDRLEIVRGLLGKKNRRKRRRNSIEQPLLMLTGLPTPSIHIETNINSQTDLTKQNDKFYINKESMNQWQVNGSMLMSQTGLNNFGIAQCRQNSLPSSLSNNGTLTSPVWNRCVSKSMDSFVIDHNNILDNGVPCPFCGTTHKDYRPECQEINRKTINNQFNLSSSVIDNQSETSLHNNETHLIPSRSQTILHAEVHQEFDSHRNTSKSATFGGKNPDVWEPEVSQFKSLPPYINPPQLNVSESYYTTDLVDKWTHGDDSRNMTNNHRGDLPCRRLSQISVSTDESGSFSDGDSLERDLFSVQNISSFHEFVNTTSFIPCRDRLTPLSNTLQLPIPLTPCTSLQQHKSDASTDLI